MKNYRYEHLIMPINRYIEQLTPKARRLVKYVEGGLLLVLVTSIVFYVY